MHIWLWSLYVLTVNQWNLIDWCFSSVRRGQEKSGGSVRGRACARVHSNQRDYAHSIISNRLLFVKSDRSYSRLPGFVADPPTHGGLLQTNTHNVTASADAGRSLTFDACVVQNANCRPGGHELAETDCAWNRYSPRRWSYRSLFVHLEKQLPPHESLQTMPFANTECFVCFFLSARSFNSNTKQF